MEMENSHVIKKQRLEVFDILKEALRISGKNINFLIFTLLSSLPLLLLWVYNESFLQRTLVEATKVLVTPPGYFKLYWSIPEQVTKLLGKDFFYSVIQLFLLYLVPLHLLELCTVFVTVDLASKIYTEERPMTLSDMVHKPIRNKRLRHAFITLVYVLLWSTCVLLPLIWFAANLYVFLRLGNHVFELFFAEMYGVALVVMLAKYLEWSAVWSVGIVISILEEKIYGVQALALSLLFTRDSKRQGRLLMLVFLAWGLGLRLASLYAGCYEGGTGIIVQISLFCIGNVIKWVACMVYFYDCKRQMLEKKVDEEVGRKVKAGDK